MQILTFFLLVLGLASFSQTAQHAKIPTPEWIEQHIDSLRDELLPNKRVPADYEHSILAALIRYPDLKDTRIMFKRKALTTTMAARPTVLDMFRHRSKRHYKIFINHTRNKRKSPLLKNIPYEARVGVIGHELAHIVDYNNKNFITIIGNGVAYVVSDSFKQKLEYKIDGMTINRGLGPGLYAFRLFVEEEAQTTRKYRKFKEKIYMTSAEIAQVIHEMNSAVDNN
ncbi:MAG TPA: hypothetical protein ENN24_00920 [Bacteroidetes bacterium]|nr:hypothetical protein [Bacteroidota bacterium]